MFVATISFACPLSLMSYRLDRTSYVPVLLSFRLCEHISGRDTLLLTLNPVKSTPLLSPAVPNQEPSVRPLAVKTSPSPSHSRYLDNAVPSTKSPPPVSIALLCSCHPAIVAPASGQRGALPLNHNNRKLFLSSQQQLHDNGRSTFQVTSDLVWLPARRGIKVCARSRSPSLFSSLFSQP